MMALPVPLAPKFDMLQSTPPVAGRRSLIAGAGHRDFCGFNPRLPLPGGEASGAAELGSQADVSIHASRCREAKPGPLSFTLNSTGFNPRLPLPGGEANDGGGNEGRNGGFNPRLPLPGGEAA